MKIPLSKTLITGAEGMVGGYVDFGIRTNRRMLDVTDLTEVLRVCGEYRPKAIIHLAAETDVDRCERDSAHAYLVNSIGTYNVAVAAKMFRAKLVYVSTSGVFNGKKKSAYGEDDIPDPQNYYSRSKYLGEIIVRGMLQNYIIARVCWMFGGGPRYDQKFVAKIIKQLKTRKAIHAINDQFGSPTFGKDLIGSLKLLLARDAKGVYHLSNSGKCSRFDMANEIVRLLNLKTKVVPVSSSHFNLDAARGLNESMVSRNNFMRPWKTALREYILEEWKASIVK